MCTSPLTAPLFLSGGGGGKEFYMVCGELGQDPHSVVEVVVQQCGIVWLRTRHSGVMSAFFFFEM